MESSSSSEKTWWGGMAQARTRIQALADVLGPFQFLQTLEASETPNKDLLRDEALAEAIRSRLLDPQSGRGDDNLCNWLFDTYQTGDPDLQTLVLGFVPTICGAYLPRVARKPEEPLGGFEAVLLALYTVECKDRDGRAIVVNIPNLSQPSLYTPRVLSSNPTPMHVGLVSAPLEPQNEVKSTKRAIIVGIALELFLRKIAVMPARSKIELCVCARQWAMQGCSWVGQVDEIAELALVGSGASKGSVSGKQITEADRSGGASLLNAHSLHISSPEVERWRFGLEHEGESRVHLPLQILRPLLKILAHCLMAPMSFVELKAVASAATKALYARATHELIPEAILSTRSLLRLDQAAKMALLATTSASLSTPKPRKPEILLTST
ncbi:hypothetical protein O6H91_21G056200 [Diphasiastrum complanatum]|uniref:Uncharacterized protein n=2 Tax=Diphasiastrum complanatum TaxID=34168 RepID=A0ACC2AKU2_DIPCM|nr:hypothetical protein O6H91_Y190200 [Diphasiastrum complanatum]KAJ7295412.1 hypothetical protein O6H91_Y190200 [Diphasiastrum complanatum]KAJ7295413.1 hypothetical protein O6H91_Y190200 [Diphasiastrum complanatum]KAJ7518111.1 hypothetical protein O6H91_21G056200 [Diphasiastrum complanatum]KAJ7518112.1 hypothetical protein O6H91_21G056200 [Diphasiastrum complanatum]